MKTLSELVLLAVKRKGEKGKSIKTEGKNMIEIGKTKADMSPGKWLDHIQAIWPMIASGEIREYELATKLSKEEYKDIGQYRLPMLEMAYQKEQQKVNESHLERYGTFVKAASADKPLDFIKSICSSNNWSVYIASRSKLKHPLFQYQGEDAVILQEPNPDIISMEELSDILIPDKEYSIQGYKIKKNLSFCKAVFIVSEKSLEAFCYTFSGTTYYDSKNLLADYLQCQIIIGTNPKSKTGKAISFYENHGNRKFDVLQTWAYTLPNQKVKEEGHER